MHLWRLELLEWICIKHLSRYLDLGNELLLLNKKYDHKYGQRLEKNSML
jgi:hypothetical protein